MKFYKDATGFWLNGELTPQGFHTLQVDTDNATISRFRDNYTIYNGLISGLLKENGTGYSSKADLLSAVGDFFVDAAQVAANEVLTLAGRVEVLEEHTYDTLWIDYWQVETPAIVADKYWYDTVHSVYYCDGVEWLEIYGDNTLPLSQTKFYIKKSDNTTYAWSGTAMVPTSAPLIFASQAEAESGTEDTKIMTALKVAQSFVYNVVNKTFTGLSTTSKTIQGAINESWDGIFNREPRVIPLGVGNNIDLSAGEKFTKTCGANQAFTITNPIVGKFFYLTITGGTLAASTFTGYTTTWILNALVTDYVPASTNILVGEVRAAGTIHLFWSE